MNGILKLKKSFFNLGAWKKKRRRRRRGRIRRRRRRRTKRIRRRREKGEKEGEGWAQHAFNTGGWFLRGDSAP